MLHWCSERPQNTRYSPRRKGKQSTNTTLHLFFCYHTGELSFFGEGGWARGSFLLGRNFRVFSEIMKEGNFASATSIAAGVWFSSSDHFEYNRGYRYQGTINTFFQNRLVYLPWPWLFKRWIALSTG